MLGAYTPGSPVHRLWQPVTVADHSSAWMTLTDSFQVLRIFCEWPIKIAKLPHHKAQIEIILMCSKEIDLPEEMEKIIIKFFGVALKILSW